jgi:hypothetical protein
MLNIGKRRRTKIAARIAEVIRQQVANKGLNPTEIPRSDDNKFSPVFQVEFNKEWYSVEIKVGTFLFEDVLDEELSYLGALFSRFSKNKKWRFGTTIKYIIYNNKGFGKERFALLNISEETYGIRVLFTKDYRTMHWSQQLYQILEFDKNLTKREIVNDDQEVDDLLITFGDHFLEEALPHVQFIVEALETIKDPP